VEKIAQKILPSFDIKKTIEQRISMDDFSEEGGYDYEGYDVAWDQEYQNILHDLTKEIARELLH
jgi:hypothetical protein